MVERVECILVGAGIVGLAIARALALRGAEVLVLESADAIGTGISSRNSEVIHAGIYYAAGSLKAQTCVAGRELLYRYAESHDIAHRRTGKLIVAGDADEVAILARLRDASRANGLTGPADALRMLDADAARRMEPELVCTAALLSPATGIIDSHGLMLAYRGEAEAHGASIALSSPFISAKAADGGWRTVAGSPGAEIEIASRILVNSAGLEAQAVARAIAEMPARLIPPRFLAKGSYFTLSGRAPFRHLIYPVPVAAGLGVHVTLDLAGQARFGPDVEYVDRIDYAVDSRRAESFYEAVRRYWPALIDGALQPGYAGIRPKLQGPNDPVRDFVLQGPREHGLAGLVNLFGIESPGLTGSLSLAAAVCALLDA